MVGEVGDAALPLGRGQQAGDGADGDGFAALAGQGCGEVLPYVVGGVDEAAENNWRVAVCEELLDLRGEQAKFAVLVGAFEFGGTAGKREEPAVLGSALGSLGGFS